VFVVLAFLMGGGSRGDIASLVILRPLAVLVCGFALITLKRSQVFRHRALIGFAVATLVVVAIQLIPLPPAIWQALPGRALLIDVDRTAGLGPVWRPWSMAPAATWNALFSLSVPLAVLLLGIQISADERASFLPICIGLGCLSALWGLCQIVGPPEGPFYLYRITTTGSAVGLFANRNHAAVLLACVFPLLAVFATADRTRSRFRGGAALTIGAVIVPLLLVTGSRAGILIGIVGLAGALLLHILWGRDRGSLRHRRRGIVIILVGIVVLVMLFLVFARADAIHRLVSSRSGDELRFQAWGPIAAMIWKYFPFGGGFGSFAPVFQIDEPYALLMPTFLNHAHNDWLEIVMDGGFAALMLLIVAIIFLARRAIFAGRTPARGSLRVMQAQAGVTVLVMLGLASVFDYPLRVPSLQCVAVIAILWLCCVHRSADVTD
jgi:hypothetical protein